MLTDHAEGVTIAQTQAIFAWLGRKHGLIPESPLLEALTHKLIADANDVLYEMTRFNGEQTWTAEAWVAYRPRLARWMAIFEATGRRFGLTADSGWMLGPGASGLADLTAATLWGVMTEKLPPLRPLLHATAPALAGLCDRVAARPEQAALRARSAEAWGEVWCGGEIEASLRAALAADPALD